MNKNDIKRFRYQHKLSQQEMADLLNMPVTTFANYENGNAKLQRWFMDKMRKMMDDFGYDEDTDISTIKYFGYRKKAKIDDPSKIVRKEEPTLTDEQVVQQLIEVVKQSPVKIIGHKPVIEGVGKDEPIVINEKGGGQSASPYRMDLIDPRAILEISKVLKEGADKYGENNWKKIDVKDHLNHLLVHVYAYLAGDTSDEHLSHACCRAIFALSVEKEETK